MKYAKTASPPPKWSPWHVATITAFGAAIFLATLGADGQAQTIAALIAGAVAFFPFWRQQKKHEAAVTTRYTELLRDAGDDGLPLTKNTGHRLPE